MKAALLTAAPPIYTADGKVIAVGDTVYGVDTECTKDRVPHLEKLVVTQLDLGARRQVRLRRAKGTEWTWSAQDGRGYCRTDEHLIFKCRDKAVRVAVAAAQEQARKIEAEAMEDVGSIEQAKADYQYEVTQIRKRLKKAKTVAAAYRKKLAAIK